MKGKKNDCVFLFCFVLFFVFLGWREGKEEGGGKGEREGKERKGKKVVGNFYGFAQGEGEFRVSKGFFTSFLGDVILETWDIFRVKKGKKKKKKKKKKR